MDLGNWNISYGTADELSGSLSSDGKGYGEIVRFGSGTLVGGRVYCLKSDLSWEIAVDNGPVSSSLLGVALGTSAADNGVLLRGIVRCNPHATLVVGQKVYNEGNGRVSPDAPSTSGDVVRVLGYCVGADNHIYFNPDNTWIEVA